MNDEIVRRCHILMVTHVLPYPPAAGNEIRIYRMLQWLRHAGFRVSLVLRPLEEDVSNECITGLKQVVDDLYVFDSRCAIPECLGSAFTPDEAEKRPHLADMQSGFCPPWFAQEVNALITDIKPDVLIAQYIFTSRLLLTDAAAPLLKIIDTHDLFSQKQETVEKYGIANFGLMMSAEDESLLFKRADALLAIQQLELKAIQRMVPERQVLLTGFDVDIFSADPALREQGVVLIVASSNEFNVRGTQDFLDCTWPLVRERCSFARLRLVGKICGFVHTADPSVEKIGFVRDLADEYGRASVVVNPCGVGTGLKIKTVEALAWGKAHVGWPASADGLREIADLPYIVATDVVEFADAVTDLLLNADRACALGSAAHKFAEQYLGGEVTYGPLAALINSHVTTSREGGVNNTLRRG